MKTLKVIAGALISLAIASPASAVLVTYTYEFDRPIFDDPPFAPLNLLLQGAGDTISGSATFDTDKISSSNADVDFYLNIDKYPSTGGFTHTGELDSILDPAGILTASTGTTELQRIYDWGYTVGTAPDEVHYDLDLQLGDDYFQILAVCSSQIDSCDGEPDYLQAISFNDLNLKLTKTVYPAPLPAPAALLGLGLAGFLATRRLSK